MNAVLRAIVIIGVVALVRPSAGAESRSSPLARQLAELLAAGHLSAVAARHPGAADTFVAAMVFPNQLLVISSRHAQPLLLEQRLERGEFRDAYMDLQGAGIKDGRVFVMDTGADGLAPSRDKAGAFDVVYSDGVTTTNFDGNWKGQKLSEADYRARFERLEGQYAAMLDALLEASRHAAAATAQR